MGREAAFGLARRVTSNPGAGPRLTLRSELQCVYNPTSGHHPQTLEARRPSLRATRNWGLEQSSGGERPKEKEHKIKDHTT